MMHDFFGARIINVANRIYRRYALTHMSSQLQTAGLSVLLELVECEWKFCGSITAELLHLCILMLMTAPSLSGV